MVPQHAPAFGKNAKRQMLVSLTLAFSEVPVTASLRPFPPGSWTSYLAGPDRAGAPNNHRAYWIKPEIALAEIDRMRTAGVCPSAACLQMPDWLECAVPAGAHRAWLGPRPSASRSSGRSISPTWR